MDYYLLAMIMGIIGYLIGIFTERTINKSRNKDNIKKERNDL